MGIPEIPCADKIEKIAIKIKGPYLEPEDG